MPLIYASSAAVYGASTVFKENDRAAERPLNVYGYSKLLFDQYVRAATRATSARRKGVRRSSGLRYFNVYGPGEAHKGSMASVAFHLHGQVAATGEARLFEGSGGYAAGEQRRDFVHVGDVVDVNLWFSSSRACPASSTSARARARRSTTWRTRSSPGTARAPSATSRFRTSSKSRYQSFTEADITALRAAGYSRPFRDVRAGIKDYLDALGSRP